MLNPPNFGFERKAANAQSIYLRKKIQGVGINDADYMVSQESELCPIYNTWQQMLRRCYSPKYHIKKPTYSDCEVCEEWKTYSNFQKWVENNPFALLDGYELDKDILAGGSGKLYSPDFCEFIPRGINSVLNIRSKKPKYEKGVYGIGKSYISMVSDGKGKPKHLGSFKTVEEASEVYKKAKSKVIKEKADYYVSLNMIKLKVWANLYSIADSY